MRAFEQRFFSDVQAFVSKIIRFADFQADRMPQLASELVQLKPDVIFGAATIQAVALKKATDTIPIVVGALANPAVTIARSLSDTFAGIAPAGVTPFIAAQLVGMLASLAIARWLWG